MIRKRAARFMGTRAPHCASNCGNVSRPSAIPKSPRALGARGGHSQFEAATIRRPRQPPATDAVNVNAADIGAPAEAQAEPVLAPATPPPNGQRPAPREQLVELALLARSGSAASPASAFSCC